jgi:hypothetical protein
MSKTLYSKHALKSYEDCYHRAIQRTLLHTPRSRSGFGFSVVDFGLGVTEGGVRAENVNDTGGWHLARASCQEVCLR